MSKSEHSGYPDSTSSPSRPNGQPRRHPPSPRSESSSEQPSVLLLHVHGIPTPPTPGFSHRLWVIGDGGLHRLRTADRYPANISNVHQLQYYDDSSDPSAALTPLEHESDAVPRPPPQERKVWHQERKQPHITRRQYTLHLRRAGMTFRRMVVQMKGSTSHRPRQENRPRKS